MHRSLLFDHLRSLRLALTCLACLHVFEYQTAAQTPSGPNGPAGPSRLAAAEQPAPAAQQPPLLTQPPAWHPLPAARQQRIDQILAVWEGQSDKMKTFRSDFMRWEFEPVFGPKDQPLFIAKGEIRYAAPDKGLYRETKKGYYQPPSQESESASYQPREGETGDYWLCDGQAVYEYRISEKLVVETRLPEEMQGQGIAEGPLPFIFSANAEKLNQRYWIREIEPPEGRDDLVLEFVPRFTEDMQNFIRAEVSLDRKQILPVILRLDRSRNASGVAYTVWQLRESNMNGFLDKLSDFMSSFVAPKTPSGWRRAVEDYRATAADAQPPQNAAQPGANGLQR